MPKIVRQHSIEVGLFVARKQVENRTTSPHRCLRNFEWLHSPAVTTQTSTKGAMSRTKSVSRKKHWTLVRIVYICIYIYYVHVSKPCTLVNITTVGCINVHPPKIYGTLYVLTNQPLRNKTGESKLLRLNLICSFIYIYIILVPAIGAKKLLNTFWCSLSNHVNYPSFSFIFPMKSWRPDPSCHDTQDSAEKTPWIIGGFQSMNVRGSFSVYLKDIAILLLCVHI